MIVCVLLFTNPAGWDGATRYSCPNQRCRLGTDGAAWLPTANWRQYCVHINPTWRLTQALIYFPCLSHFIYLMVHCMVPCILQAGYVGTCCFRNKFFPVTPTVIQSCTPHISPLTNTPDSPHLQYQVFNSFLHTVLYLYSIVLRGRKWFMHSHSVCPCFVYRSIGLICVVIVLYYCLVWYACFYCLY